MPPLITDVKLESFTPPAASLIEVTTTIGSKQSGAWAVFVDGAFLAGGNTPTPVALGPGAALAGKILEVSAVVNDTQGSTDDLSVSVQLTGLAAPIGIAHVGQPGGRAAYSVLVVFA